MLSSSRKQALESAATLFAANVAVAHDHLAGRGVTPDMIEAFRLGVVPDDPPAVFLPFVGRLAIPFCTPTGVVSIRYRCIEDHDCKEEGHPKYLQGKGEGDHLYNVGALHERHPVVAVCEGEIDAMFADLIVPSVGVPGATKWRPYWSRLFEDYDKVFILGDGDRAGRDFCDKLTELLPNAQPTVMPPDMDVNAFYLAHGQDALEEYILGRNAT